MMFKLALISSLVALLAAPVCAQDRKPLPTIRALLGPEEPIAYAGHGQLFSANGVAFAPDAKTMRAAHERYIRVMMRSAPDHIARKAQIALDRLGKPETLDHDAGKALILWVLTAHAGAGDAWQMHLRNRDILHVLHGAEIAKTKSMVGYLRKVAAGIFIGDTKDPDLAIPIIDATLELSGYQPYDGVGTDGLTDYMRLCQQLGVPLPPDITDGAWVVEGLQTPRLAAAGNAIVLGYQSTAPAGTCIGLPASTGNGTGIELVGLFGIFCMGEDTGKACFWDRQFSVQTGMGGGPFGISTARLDFADLTQGPPLRIAEDFTQGGGGGPNAGVCTDCHAGANPFVVYPGSALDLAPKGYVMNSRFNWHVPVPANPNWPRNRDIADARDRAQQGVIEPLGLRTYSAEITANAGHSGAIQSRSCITCHEFPDIGDRNISHPSVPPYLEGYCGTVLAGATRYMPQGATDTAVWGAPDTPTALAHYEFVRYLRRECGLPDN